VRDIENAAYTHFAPLYARVTVEKRERKEVRENKRREGGEMVAVAWPQARNIFCIALPGDSSLRTHGGVVHGMKWKLYGRW